MPYLAPVSLNLLAKVPHKVLKVDVVYEINQQKVARMDDPHESKVMKVDALYEILQNLALPLLSTKE